MDTAFKERCILLRGQGHTLSEIVSLTGRPKTSVYTHIAGIPLDPNRKKLISKAAGERIRLFPLARKGKSVRPFKPFTDWGTETVSLVAHLLFDGGIYPRSGCVYNNRSIALLEQVEEHMSHVYEFEPIRYQNPLTGVARISYHNVTLGSYMQGKAKELLGDISQLPLEHRRTFLRAFFDDEGCIDYRPEKNRRSIRGYQKDVRILELIQDLLRDTGIESRIVLPNEVMIVGKENLAHFSREVDFSSGVYVNGKRTNSRWKRSLEKRAILRMAIESYRS